MRQGRPKINIAAVQQINHLFLDLWVQLIVAGASSSFGDYPGCPLYFVVLLQMPDLPSANPSHFSGHFLFMLFFFKPLNDF